MPDYPFRRFCDKHKLGSCAINFEYLISATASGSANSIVALGGTRISVAKISRYSPVPGFYDGTISRTSDLLLLKGGADVTGEEDLGFRHIV